MKSCDQFTAPHLPQLPPEALRGLTPELANWITDTHRSFVEWGRAIEQVVRDVNTEIEAIKDSLP